MMMMMLFWGEGTVKGRVCNTQKICVDGCVATADGILRPRDLQQQQQQQQQQQHPKAILKTTHISTIVGEVQGPG
jgi:hypothetical protein